MNKTLNNVVENILGQLDNLGFQLDAIGVENQINRHNLIAFVMAGQKRVEGEIDSIGAKIDTGKSKVESIVDSTEQLVKSGVDLALFPAKYSYERIKAQL